MKHAVPRVLCIFLLLILFLLLLLLYLLVLLNYKDIWIANTMLSYCVFNFIKYITCFPMHFSTDSIYIISTDITNLNRCPNNKHNKSCHFHSIELPPKYCPKVPDSKRTLDCCFQAFNTTSDTATTTREVNLVRII